MTKDYESLRSCALDQTAVIGKHSLAYVLLVREGVAGWLKGWEKCREMTASREGKPSKTPIDDKTFLSENCAVSVILANILITHIERAVSRC